ncbi:MAG: DUF2851 family protein [Bacteroidota bacterium]
MNEDFIVYVWRYKLFCCYDFKSTNGSDIEILSYGERNFDSGPDFFNAKIRIGDQLWAGNVEIHVNSSDWYRHKHQNDKAYNNVILHVVYNHDKEVEVLESVLPVLELKNYISEIVTENYKELTGPSKSFLSCAKSYSFTYDFEYQNWIESLFVKRLETKTDDVRNQLDISVSHWEQVLFRSISRSFGLKLNGEAFANFSSSFDFKLVQNVSKNINSVEALFFGQAGFLDEEIDGEYFGKLKTEYSFLKRKYSLKSVNNSQFKFFRTRPANFPTIRMSQLAHLYQRHPDLFSKILEVNSVRQMKKILSSGVSDFWKDHYTFKSGSKISERRLSSSFMELLILNSVIPVRFTYFRAINNSRKIEESLELAEYLMKENNKIISEFEKYGWRVNNAKESQALLELNNSLCHKNLCLNCLIGKRVLERNTV